MRAMVLAAGLGTRLRPLTDDRPKALVEVCGRTLLEIMLERLRGFGIQQVVINVHHFADKMAEYLRAHHDFGMEIEISSEDVLLDTGGGLKKVAYFLRDGRDDAFLLHNVDVISDIDLEKMVHFHHQRRALATLAVQERKTSRYLFFDEELRLCGRRFERENKTEMVRSCPTPQALAFCGIHVISSRFLDMMSEEGAFSIINSYLRLAGQSEPIFAFRADEYYWRDLGRPENVQQAAEDMAQRKILL
jgi:NDP-sugar pyrophosphorylase family protein